MKEFHTITLKTKNLEGSPTGSNVEVLLDGNPVKYCRGVKIEAKALDVNKITLEIFAYAEINVLGELVTKITPLKLQDISIEDEVKEFLMGANLKEYQDSRDYETLSKELIGHLKVKGKL